MTEDQLRQDICEVGRRMYGRGFVTATDGNISARTPEGGILISPTGSCLGTMQPGDLVLIDFEGRVLAGEGRPSSEHWMHRTLYAQRPDVMAAIHAHPPITIAFTVAGINMSQHALPEMIIAFGRVPVTAYATPATEEGAEVIRDFITRFDALVLDRHGSLTVGKTLTEAFYKLERLEHAAQIMLAAHQLGGARDLSPDDLAKLAAIKLAALRGQAAGGKKP